MRYFGNKLLALLLAAVLAMSFAGCAAKPNSSEPAAEPNSSEPAAESLPAESSEPSAEETEPENKEGSLFLTVSSITFSVAGESEDVYLGLVPRELVTWESEDPDIVSVENGVLTAVGVGTTMIHASYADRRISCAAGCLAQTPEELKKLDEDTRSLPKRLPPEIDMDAPCTYFDQSAIVGDSVTYIMMAHENSTNALGDMLFLAKGGTSMNGFVLRFKNVSYRGREGNLEDIIAKSKVERVYFLIGSNDVGSISQRKKAMQNWNIMLDRIWEKSPDVDIVVLSYIPKYEDARNCGEPGTYNYLMEEYNSNLRNLAKERGCKFVDMSPYFQDHWNRLATIYRQGNFHMNKLGCMTWMQTLRFYAQYESEGGILE